MGFSHCVCRRRWYSGVSAGQRCVSKFRKICYVITITLDLGAKVIAAAGSQEKLDVSVKFGGADHVVNYTKKDWQKDVLKITGGKGVDVIYDPVGMIRGKHAFLYHIKRMRVLKGEQTA